MDYGRNKGTRKMGELRAEEVVFAMRSEKFVEIGGAKGEEWNEEKWEARMRNIRRMELIRRATAPRRLTEPGSIDTLDVLRQKTKGNLTESEQEVLDSLLHQLRLVFVQTAERPASSS